MKNQSDGARLMGFGHRVYQQYDPRAKIVKKTADELLHRLGVNDALLDIATATGSAAGARQCRDDRRRRCLSSAHNTAWVRGRSS